MTILTRRAVIGAAMLLLPATAGAQPAGITVANPWTRAAGQGGTGAGFMTLRNAGAAPDRLVSARAAIARTVELHTHTNDNGVMRMRPVPSIEVPARGEVQLRPSGFHLMLIGLTAPLRQGERIPVTLVFERAGEVQVELAVESAGARGPGAGGHHH
ncbi:copper chaperone PCu(A)C [Falsiroseomonas ponticola]|jgi:copper(I)-binding protein|uniref:copper chaperone PCu(A)C n=1 Tax=Falsiroseomonas ponticola TaxID=2786951 RepID=UPI0019339C25|nr:copper chaperone PCu(A)C [Roseomonas ponticola]